MTTLYKASRILFGIPWIIFAIQHFMYSEFVATLVPAYMPARIFWAYLAGIAMMAAGISLITGVLARTAALLLGIMLSIFILQLHTSILGSSTATTQNWTRAVQDISLAGAAYMLTGKPWLVRTGRFLFAGAIVFLGIQHAMRIDFVTARVPDFFPARMVWDYLVGGIMVVSAACVLINLRARLAASVLAVLLAGVFLVGQLPGLISEPHNPLRWTTGMLELAIAAGAVVLLSLLLNHKVTKVQEDTKEYN
jgi:uncharacterized membrane protein YphA (DoxX/SURF4 family)